MAANRSLIYDFSKGAEGWQGDNYSRRESIAIANPPAYFKSNEAGYAESKAFTGSSPADGGLRISASTDAFVIANFTVRQSTKQARASSINTAKSPLFEVKEPGIIEIEYNITSSDGVPSFQLLNDSGQVLSAVNAVSGVGAGVARFDVSAAGRYQIQATASSYNFSNPYRSTAEDGEGLSTTNLILKNVSFTSVNQAPSTPTYTISPSTTSINEGQQLTTTILTTGVANGTTLYWGLSGTGINASDFSAGNLTGQETVSNGAFSFTHTLASDLSTNEGNESLQIKLFSDAARTKQVGSTATITVNDTSKAQAGGYLIRTYPTTLEEGTTATFILDSLGAETGKTVYWKLGGQGITDDDFTPDNSPGGRPWIGSGALNGSGWLGEDGTFGFSRVIRNDIAKEGDEVIEVMFYDDIGMTKQIGETGKFTIRDTSVPTTPLPPPPPVTVKPASYKIFPSAISFTEGQVLTTTIRSFYDNGTFYATDNGTTLYWELSGTGINASDFSAGALTGFGVTANGTFSFSHNLSIDQLPEGIESLQINLYRDSARTMQAGPAATVTITDNTGTSRSPVYAITPSVASVNEGQSFTTTITTSNVADGTILTWSLSGAGIDESDFYPRTLTGSGVVSKGSFSFTRTLQSDQIIEGSESVLIKLYSDSGRTRQVGSTATIIVNDTSTPESAFRDGFLGDDRPNILRGGSEINTITGLGNADTLTGGAGADTFRYLDLKDSVLASFDRITDFVTGLDLIDAPNPVAAENIKHLGAAPAFTQQGIGAVLTSGIFQASRAATFTAQIGGTTRTFLAINDGISGFDATQDAVIEITGYAGRLTHISII